MRERMEAGLYRSMQILTSRHCGGCEVENSNVAVTVMK